MLRLTKGREQAGRGEGGSLNSPICATARQYLRDACRRNADTVSEAPYTNGLNENDVHLVKELFVQLAVLKAAQLGALPVLSGHYAKEASGIGFTAMRFALYISRSKAGRQYWTACRARTPRPTRTATERQVPPASKTSTEFK